MFVAALWYDLPRQFFMSNPSFSKISNTSFSKYDPWCVFSNCVHNPSHIPIALPKSSLQVWTTLNLFFLSTKLYHQISLVYVYKLTLEWKAHIFQAWCYEWIPFFFIFFCYTGDTPHHPDMAATFCRVRTVTFLSGQRGVNSQLAKNSKSRKMLSPIPRFPAPCYLPVQAAFWNMNDFPISSGTNYVCGTHWAWTVSQTNYTLSYFTLNLTRFSLP